MAYQGINTGSSPNSGTGDSLIQGAEKVNSNFVELYNIVGNGSTTFVGIVTQNQSEEKLKEYMKWDSVVIEVNLHQGNDTFECYTCDFTHDYIDINADYRN
mgnify:CR=1 FL=1